MTLTKKSETDMVRAIFFMHRTTGGCAGECARDGKHQIQKNAAINGKQILQYNTCYHKESSFQRIHIIYCWDPHTPNDPKYNSKMLSSFC